MSVAPRYAPERTSRAAPVGYIPGLDGLRAFAVMAVIFHHANELYDGEFPTSPLGAPLAALLGGAWCGVDLFFVLSGFLITGILHSTKEHERYFRTFYARRALRIMPLYYGYLLFALLLLPRCPGGEHLRTPAADAWSLVFYYFNFRLGAPGASLHIGPLWSLAVEEHFYALWPLVIWLLPREKAMRVCVVGALASLLLRVALVALGAGMRVPYFITPCRLDGLLAGSWLALARQDAAQWTRVTRNASWVMASAAAVLLGMFAWQGHFLPFYDPRLEPGGPAVGSQGVITVGLTLLAVAFAALIALVVDREPHRRLVGALERLPLRTIGRFSYAMYVFHSVILLTLSHFVIERVASLQRLPGVVGKPLAGAATVLLATVAGWLSYNLYERHFLGLKRFFPSS